MNKYIVGYMNFFDNNLLLEEIEAKSAIAAARIYLKDFTTFESFAETLEELQEECFNCDCLINVIEINNARAGRKGGGLQNLSAELDSQVRFQ